MGISRLAFVVALDGRYLDPGADLFDSRAIGLRVQLSNVLADRIDQVMVA